MLLCHQVIIHATVNSWAVCGTRASAQPTTGANSAEQDGSVLEGDEHQNSAEDEQETASTTERCVFSVLLCMFLVKRLVVCCSTGLTRAEQAHIGFMCQRILDLGRLDYLRRHNFDASLKV